MRDIFNSGHIDSLAVANVLLGHVSVLHADSNWKVF